MQTLVLIMISISSALIILHTMIRVIRYFYKFPMPQFLADIIDNPLRRKIQPPADTAIRHGIERGMIVLEVGPGNGRYTTASAKLVGNTGKVYTIDIEKK
jgi:tRNA G46 methylase TrmB